MCNITIIDEQYSWRNEKEFLNLLAYLGGSIVSSNNCTEIEISTAREEHRMLVDEDGMGFIYIPEVVKPEKETHY